MPLYSLFSPLFISSYFLLFSSSNLFYFGLISHFLLLTFRSCPLRPGETFSENYSHTEQCKPCTQCTGLMRMETPCTDSNDAKCICDYNYFFSSVTGSCELCTVCPVGQGVYSHCDHDHDTVCEECVDETFSDRESSLEPCLPCTICDEETETQLAVCTPTSDSVCYSKSATFSSCFHRAELRFDFSLLL